MELSEKPEDINKLLLEHYGLDTSTAQPIWRVVWSEDQFEMRLGTYTDYSPGGIYLRTVTEVRNAPKYRQWIQKKYVLERLVVVPDMNIRELPATKMSYEPIWAFMDKGGNYLPPRFDACKFIIDLIYSVQYADHSMARYKNPEGTQEEAMELQKQRVDTLMEELWGDESSLMLTTKTGESVIVPRNYEKEKN